MASSGSPPCRNSGMAACWRVCRFSCSAALRYGCGGHPSAGRVCPGRTAPAPEPTLRDTLERGASSSGSPTQSGSPRGLIPQNPKNSDGASGIHPALLQDVMQESSPPAREREAPGAGPRRRSSQFPEISSNRGRCWRGCV